MRGQGLVLGDLMAQGRSLRPTMGPQLHGCLLGHRLLPIAPFRFPLSAALLTLAVNIRRHLPSVLSEALLPTSLPSRLLSGRIGKL